MALAYAAAVNEEARDLRAAGVDVVQIDEPYLQARPEKARKYGLQAIDRALEGIPGETALHICFGYGHIVHEKPAAGYAFLEELNDSLVGQISLECAQPKLDLSVLRRLPDKKIQLGVMDLQHARGRDSRDCGRAYPAGSRVRRRRALDRGAGLRNEVPPSRGRVREAAGDGGGRFDRAR